MPLVRVEVRNEYGLGMPELYNEVNREDPKAVLDGVAVAGLVGILRQLGDLAEFAAEVFHGLQEQVLVTSSRSHKLIVRMHNIEAALPPLEMAILAQRSHLHFAYTAGSHWHARLRSEQNHFIYSDLPQCIMDSYEESRDPPRLHLLDKFDPGGPGSCLKRYSDPTFFKKASASSTEVHISNVQREKTTHQSKQKKRTRRRNEKEIYDVPMSIHSSRMQSASPDASGQSFSSRDVSTFESANGSDRRNHSNSFDLRTGSNYIECVFRPSYSTQSEENEPKEVVSAAPKRRHNDSLDSASFDEQSGLSDANIQNISSEEQTAPRPSCVTWDEKTEIMETTVQSTETTDILCTLQQEGALNFSADDQMDFDIDDEHMPASVSGGGQPEDIDSETDYYMDALNTIESESEIDLDCKTKRELQRYSSKNKAEDDRPMARPSDAHSVNSESHTLTSISLEKVISGPSRNSSSPETHVEDHCFLNNEVSKEITKSVPLETNAYTQAPQITGTSLIPRSSPKVLMSENRDIVDDSNVGAISSIGSPSGSTDSTSQAPLSDKIVITCESPMPPSASSGVHPVMFWTNGGLLGLEPSKPPDFGVPTAARQESLLKNKDECEQVSSENNIPGDNGDAARPDMVGSSKFEQSSDFNHSNSYSYGHLHDSCSSTTSKPAINGVVNQDDLKASKSDGNGPSQIFDFTNRLLVNGLRRQLSLVGDERLANSVRSDISEQTSRPKAHQISTSKSFRESFGSGSTVMSSCSSPPLEHMKISFQPIDGFEISKLKLKFPDGSSCHESSGDIFPSFQLVPEPSLSLHDSGSDSDDDTFCRSSPCISDDCCSHNSEQWEYGESPGSRDNEVNDGCKISSEQSVLSSSLLMGSKSGGDFLDNSGFQSPFTEHGVEQSLSVRLLDLPNFDSLNASVNQDISDSDRNYFHESHSPKEPTPPPLPPMQWRGFKQHPNEMNERENTLSEALNYALNLKLPSSTISQQPKPAPVKQNNDVETIQHTPKGKQPDLQEPNGHRDADWFAKGKLTDENDDFLQQIRAKSFNLRRTASALPMFTPGVPTNIKVTAILEKANAIRQAVGSDDGTDDDNWSDT